MGAIKNKVLMSWSTGKDSAFALYKLMQPSDTFEICGLLTTITVPFDRISIHGVRRKLLEKQAEQLGLPLHIVEIPYPCSDAIYGAIWEKFLTSKNLAENISHIAFGDLFLEDVRQYRETKLASTSLQAMFPLWHQDTKKLASAIIEAGFKAIVTCVDSKKLNGSFVGRVFDYQFLKDLPDGIDPCGENGEFHTFVYAAPMFRSSINISVGSTIERDGFIYIDFNEVKAAV